MDENTQKKRRKGFKPLKSYNIVFNSTWEEGSMRAWNSTPECPKADAISFGSPQRQRPSGIIFPMWTAAYYEQERNCMKALQIFWRCRAPFSKRATYAKSNLEKKMCASVLRIPNYSCSVCHLSARVACKWAGQASSPALRPRSWLC